MMTVRDIIAIIEADGWYLVATNRFAPTVQTPYKKR